MISQGKLWPCSKGSLCWKSRTLPSQTGKWYQWMLGSKTLLHWSMWKENKDCSLWIVSGISGCLDFPAVPKSFLCYHSFPRWLRVFCLLKSLQEAKDELWEDVVRSLSSFTLWAEGFVRRSKKLSQTTTSGKRTSQQNAQMSLGWEGSKSPEDCDLSSQRTGLCRWGG